MNSRREKLKKAKYTFAIAEMHFRAAITLLKVDKSDADDVRPSLLPSGYTLYSLALELYLKCLRLEQSQKPRKTHDLLKLFEDLNETSKDLIEEGYETLFQESDWGRTANLNYPNYDFSLRAVLGKAKGGFEEWRYFHEATLENRRNVIDFNLYEALSAVRAFIIVQYPNWKEIDNNEMIGRKISLTIPNN